MKKKPKRKISTPFGDDITNADIFDQLTVILSRVNHLTEQVQALPVKQWREAIVAMTETANALGGKVDKLGAPDSIELGGHTYVRSNQDD